MEQEKWSRQGASRFGDGIGKAERREARRGNGRQVVIGRASIEWEVFRKLEVAQAWPGAALPKPNSEWLKASSTLAPGGSG